LIRRKAGGTAFALTTPLITKADGTKFGKTEQGNAWLDPAMTSPYAFYQFWMHCSDEEVRKLIKVFTLLDQATIASLCKAHDAAPHERILHQAIAKELTIRVHSEAAYHQAVQTTKILFGNATLQDIQALSEQDLLDIFADVPQATLSSTQWEAVPDVVTLVSSATQGAIFQSKGEAKRTIQGGGLSINTTKIADAYQKPAFKLLQDRYLLVQKGKRDHYLIVIR
ncbi:MAG: tyrosine--tRNA ligase, partial [Bacteroidota bacterium]